MPTSTGPDVSRTSSWVATDRLPLLPAPLWLSWSTFLYFFFVRALSLSVLSLPFGQIRFTEAHRGTATWQN